MSMLIVSNAVERAKTKLDKHVCKCASLLDAPSMTIACSTMVFVGEHIHLLEEQLGHYQDLTREWRAEAQKAQRQLEALIKTIPANSNFSKEDLLSIVVSVK